MWPSWLKKQQAVDYDARQQEISNLNAVIKGVIKAGDKRNLIIKCVPKSQKD